MTLIPYRHDGQVTHRLEWETDIITAYNGSEHRIALYSRPRESLDFSLELNDADMRLFREIIFTNPKGPHEIPWFHDEQVITADVSGTSVQVDRTYLDWIAVNQTVLVTNQQGQSYSSYITVAPAGPGVVTLTLNDAKPGGQTYAAGISHICPTYAMLLADKAETGRYAVSLSTVTIKAKRTTFSSTFGTGATVATLSSLPVFERAPGAQELTQEQISAGLELIEYGGPLTSFYSYNQPNLARQLNFSVRGTTKQWYKKILYQLVGRQKSFLLPTWCADLIPHAATATVGAAATTFKIDCPPTTDANDYLNTWFQLTSFQYVQIIYTNGVVDRRAVTGVVDNTDGTQTLTVATLTGGTIAFVSLMPKCRMSTDAVEFVHEGPAISKLRLVAVAVPQ